nr:MAG TPA: protein of unknown function (DUF953) [Caudoviricetes sp.]
MRISSFSVHRPSAWCVYCRRAGCGAVNPQCV